jgi:catechol 2,3-dioxygenase-like lactoylglutathione lyase family enzyme/DNA-binding CsgD family transcriptional regulator
MAGRPPHDDQLTPGEWAVVEFVRHGLTNRAIAELRGVSMDAVKFHVANALTKLGFANRGELRHWDGVRADSALKRREGSMENLVLGPIAQISRSVSDIEAAIEWYRDVLGLPFLFAMDKMAFFDCSGTRLYLHQHHDEITPESVVYFRVGDIHAAHKELSAKGVTFSNAPHMIGRQPDGTEEWMAFFNDPDGRLLAIAAQAKPYAAAAS